jgi:Fe-S-cluster-containing hydrogenase component 2
MAFDLDDEELKATREMNGATKRKMSVKQALEILKNTEFKTYNYTCKKCIFKDNRDCVNNCHEEAVKVLTDLLEDKQ